MTRWERFNPVYLGAPFTTFTQHKACTLVDEIPKHMQYRSFKQALIDAVHKSGAHFEAIAQPLDIEVYIGVLSVIHNSSDLGYSKDRGAASF